MANITPVYPQDYIDEGRTKLNNNDQAMNNEISSLSSQISNHNHDDRYYTKAEVDAKIKRFTLQCGLSVSAINTWARVGSVSMSANLGFVMPFAGNLVDIIAIHNSGVVLSAKNGLPLSINAGDVISVIYTQYTTNDVIRIYRNGTATDTFVVAKDGNGQGPGFGNYIVLLVFEI